MEPVRLTIRFKKDGVPPGKIPLPDLAALGGGIQDALVRLISVDLGYSARTRPRLEAKELAQIALAGIGEGSTELVCEPLPESDGFGRHPTAVALSELIAGIEKFSASGAWPRFLPATVRNRLGASLAPIFDSATAIDLSLRESAKPSRECHIDTQMRASLQVPEEFDLAESVSITGQLYALNVKSETFSVDTSPKRVSVRYHGIDLRRIDTLRWKRVTVVGRPTDPRCRALDSIESVRLAKEDEEDGIMVPAEEEAVRDLEEYGRFARALSELESLGPNWDSYGAKAPRRPILEQADEFTLAAFGILLAHDVEPIAPFVVPTRAGSVQLEWSEDDRELELELGNSGQFQYLVVSHDHEAEGPCKRWHALRLVRWVLTGEDA